MTNCFPFPNTNKPENLDLGSSKSIRFVSKRKDFFCLDFGKYQSDIIKSLRRVNSDYLEVGFYDASFNRSLAQSMVPYQSMVAEESIALVYGLDERKIRLNKQNELFSNGFL